MKKICRRMVLCLLLAALVWGGSLIGDRQKLRAELVRLHVVADSDSPEDQDIKLRVRDAVLESIREEMNNLTDPEQARAYLRENLPKIEAVANRTLEQLGCADLATVTLEAERFAARVYDTFTLPSGVYDALRITIGTGEGKNWWCVAFPSLCLPATTEGFEEVACGAGFSESLIGTLEGKEGYEIRFFLLDLLGKAENFLFGE